MPIPRDVEPEEPPANADLLEFIDRRRMHQARQHRQRMLMGATIALALIAVVLAVSNVLLIRRLASRAETAAPARVVPPAPMAAAPAPTAAESQLTTALPASAAVPVPPTAATSPREEPQTPPPPAPPAPRPTVTEPDSARRTARWLVQTHGRLEAENRAAKVAEFYSGSERAFWRRVLLNVRQEPER